MTIIMLEAFVLKSILYVYHNASEIKEKLPPKYTKIYLKRVHLFLFKTAPS
jgi:hypothetical protein